MARILSIFEHEAMGKKENNKAGTSSLVASGLKLNQ